MKKTNYTIFTFTIAVLVLYIYQYLKIDENLDSIFDEGFLFLKLQAIGINSLAMESQFPTLVNSLFGEHITSNLLYLRYARYFVHLLSISLFSIASVFYLIKKGVVNSLEKKILYFLIVFLLGYLSLGGIIISYNTLQEFFIVGVIGCFLVASEMSLRKSILFYILIGFFSFLSILIILPSGILVLICILLLLWIKYLKDWKTALISTFSILMGILISALCFHFFILDLRLVLAGMVETAKTITVLNRGYDPFSFITKIILYLRDFYMGTCLLIGLMLFSFYIKKFTGHWVAVLVFILSVYVFSIYQRKPEIVLTSFLAFPIIALFVAILSQTPKISWKNLFSFNVLLSLFLFFSPLISSIGTNVYLGAKMVFFILPWSVLLMELKCNATIKEKYAKEIRFLLWFFFILIVFQPVRAMIYDIKNSGYEKLYFTQEKPISQIELTKSQKTYFDRVYGIMKEYGYQRNDVIFSTQLDDMTIVAFDGTPCGLYFQPMDFLAEKNKNKLKKLTLFS